MSLLVELPWVTVSVPGVNVKWEAIGGYDTSQKKRSDKVS